MTGTEEIGMRKTKFNTHGEIKIRIDAMMEEIVPTPGVQEIFTLRIGMGVRTGFQVVP